MQVPADCVAVAEAVAGERALRARQLRPPPSSFAEDAAAVLGPATPVSPTSARSASLSAPFAHASSHLNPSWQLETPC